MATLNWQQQARCENALNSGAARMTADRELADALALVLRRSGHARVEVRPAVAAMWAQRHGAVNQFDPHAFANLLRDIDAVVPRVSYPDVDGYANPNNGDLNYRLEIGTESSEVLYVRLGQFTASHIADDVRALVCGLIEQAALHAGADEVHRLDDDGCSNAGLRIWWD